MLRRFGAACAVGILKGLAHLPYGWIARLGNAAGRLCYVFPSERRRIARINLALCFPHWSVTQRNIAALHHFLHAIRRYVERSVQWFAPVSTLEKLVEVDSAIDLTNPSLPPTIFLGFHFVGIETGSLFSIIYCSAAAALYTSLSRIRG